MKDNRNRSLIGVILVLVGISLLSNRILGVKFLPLPEMMCFFAGGALLLLYHTKRKAWALASGSLLILFGVLRFFSNGPLHPNILGSFLFLTPGMVFMILYRQTKSLGFLIPASILLGFGGFILSTLLPLSPSIQGSLFFLLMGLSFMSIHFLGKNLIGRWPLFLGLLLFGLGGFILLISTLRVTMKFFPFLIPMVLVGLGIWMLKQNKNK